jgi:hypothetical protein
MPAPDSYTWSEAAQRYRSATTGRFVSFATVTGEVERAVSAYAGDMRGLSEQLQAGTISLDEWKIAMRQEIHDVQNTAAVMARGGVDQMSQSDWGWVGQRTRTQYDYLERFAADIASGKQPLNGRFLRRAEMYAKAARGTFDGMRGRLARQHGAAFEQRLLGAAEHCQATSRPGCVEEAAKGRQPIGTLAPIGAATCLTECRCRMRFFDADGNVIGY